MISPAVRRIVMLFLFLKGHIIVVVHHQYWMPIINGLELNGQFYSRYSRSQDICWYTTVTPETNLKTIVSPCKSCCIAVVNNKQQLISWSIAVVPRDHIEQHKALRGRLFNGWQALFYIGKLESSGNVKMKDVYKWVGPCRASNMCCPNGQQSSMLKIRWW